jgi:hypothetical protein
MEYVLNKFKKKKRSWWRRIFSSEYTRSDYCCDDVWVRNDKFRLVKFPSKINIDGKWGIFSPFDKFLGRIESREVPLEWADNIIKKEMNDKSEEGTV